MEANTPVIVASGPHMLKTGGATLVDDGYIAKGFALVKFRGGGQDLIRIARLNRIPGASTQEHVRKVYSDTLKGGGSTAASQAASAALAGAFASCGPL